MKAISLIFAFFTIFFASHGFAQSLSWAMGNFVNGAQTCELIVKYTPMSRLYSVEIYHINGGPEVEGLFKAEQFSRQGNALIAYGPPRNGIDREDRARIVFQDGFPKSATVTSRFGKRVEKTSCTNLVKVR